jgi:hypothetical protein
MWPGLGRGESASALRRAGLRSVMGPLSTSMNASVACHYIILGRQCHVGRHMTHAGTNRILRSAKQKESTTS